MNDISRRDKQTVYVVDDEDAVRDSLVWLLGSHGHRVQACASAESFLQQADKSLCGCLVTDVRMDGMSGPELHEQLTEMGILLPTIIITGHGDVPTAVAAFRNGAVDFMEKPLDDAYLLDRIAECLRHDRLARQEREYRQSVSRRLATLTRREREVLECVIAGKLNKQIAGMLGIHIKTVEVHRSRVMEKLQVTNITELIRLGLPVSVPG